ncbi:hypothetical protein TNCV_1820591 [Trichonephila clavipes]|nr:hypothetical protein TNCV_1820591 [Trichonephila clavipes]
MTVVKNGWRCVRFIRRATAEQLSTQMNQKIYQPCSANVASYEHPKQTHCSYTYADCYSSSKKAGISTSVPQLDIY